MIHVLFLTLPHIFFSPHLLDKFTSMVLVNLKLHNKHLFFLVEILSQRACRHVHM
jgi:hypothetical protein